MKKKVMTLLLAAALVLTMIPIGVLSVDAGDFPYRDVSAERWSYEGIRYAWENNLITGSSNDAFSPGDDLTKGTLAQALYQMAGCPEAPSAAAWCADATILDAGMNDGEALSRQEFVTALYQYAISQNYDVSSTTGMKYYDDNNAVSEDAAAAIKWALASGIISGVNATELRAEQTVSREQASVMLHRFAAAYESNVDVSVQIIATSDLHGWFAPWDFALDTEFTKGSLSYLSTIIEAHRAENENLIYVDCGDLVQANYVEYFIGKDSNPMIEALNYLGCDAWTFGNHEYNFKYADRQKLIEQFNGAALSGNVYMKGTDQPYLPATTIIERDGVKIGIIGMTTPMIEHFEKGNGTLDEVDVYNPMDVIPQAIEDLRKENVDCIVGLIHQGLDQENGIYGTATTDIARAFPEFDVIISGHLHREIASETANGVLICEPYYHGRALSVVDLEFTKTDDGYNLINKNSIIEKCGSVEDPAMVELMAPYKEELSGFVNTPIGQLIHADLSCEDEIKGISGVYTGPSGILTLMGTAGIYYSGADCAFLGTDYEDAGFPVGDISIKDISSSYSYSGGEITVYNATGAQVKKLLEWCADYFNPINEGDLTVSYNPSRRQTRYTSDYMGIGIYYEVDLREPTGSRIKNLAYIAKDASGNPLYNADGSLVTTPITDTSIVKMGINSYAIDQWSSKGGFLEGETFERIYSSTDEYGDEGTVRAMTIRYIREYLNGVVDGDLYQYDNWMLITGVDKESAEYKKAVELINNGTLTLPASEDGYTNIAPITVKDVEPYLETK